jgi:uncharacterized membrane protein
MKKIYKTIVLIVLVLLLHQSLFSPVKAQTSENQEAIFKATVQEVIETDTIEVAGQEAPYQILRITLHTSDQRDQELMIRHGAVPTVDFIDYQNGDIVYVRFNQDILSLSETEVIDSSQAQIVGYSRENTLKLIAVIFLVVVLAVNGFKGIRSIAALILSFIVIFMLVLPLILQNLNPVLVAALLSVLIIPITFYLSHGWKKKTHVAVAATVFALIVSSLLAATFIRTTHLSGFSSEEAGFIRVEQEQLNLRGLLLAGIIIGLLGTLDDITITQAGLVFSLKKNNPKLKLKELYQQSMEIGQDHITSMVNTLVLVYTGASMPLMLLFVNNPHPLGYVLSQELVVEEIVRTLVSSIGLILAAPLTSFLAAVLADWKNVSRKLQIK